MLGTSSHSVNERLQAAIDTFKVFLNNPFIGVSLGGIPSHRASLYGINISTQIEAKRFEGMNVLIELLAASGSFGFFFFLLFVLNLIKLHIRLIKKSKKIFNKPSVLLSITNTLGISLIVEIFALTMNQNILRPYVWLNIAFYLASLRLLKKEIRRRLCN